MPTVAAKNHPTEHMRALQWLGKKHVGVKEMPKPCITDKVGTCSTMHPAAGSRQQSSTGRDMRHVCTEGAGSTQPELFLPQHQH